MGSAEYLGRNKAIYAGEREHENVDEEWLFIPLKRVHRLVLKVE